MKNLILASASPRRIEMIRNAGCDPVVMPASIIETLPFEMEPANATMFLALKKASAILRQLRSDRDQPDDFVILAADTVVVSDGMIIGKPKDKTDAFATLASLRNRSHHVITGCCMIKPLLIPERWQTVVRKICFYEDTEVWFGNYTDEELEAYVSTDEPYDKAGGYAIQGTFGKYINRIDGDFDNVVGLPLNRVLSLL